MKNVLITGGAGFIGSNFIHYYMENHSEFNITVIDALTYAGNIGNIECYAKADNFTFIQGDICDNSLIHKILRNSNIDTIIHFAAESHVDRSILGPDSFIQTNIVGTHCLLKNARQFWLEEKNNIDSYRFHHISTDEVFGSLEMDGPAFTETTPYNPSSPYSASKASSDHLVRAYYHTYGLNITISNCSNNYGPYQYPEKLIPLSILNLLHGKPVPIYGEGRNVRDWLFVSDHCRGIDHIINKGKNGGIYNIGGMSELSNIEVVNLICEDIDNLFLDDTVLKDRFPECPAAKGIKCSSLISFVKDRPGHDFRYAMDISKISNELGFKPLESFQTGIKKTIKWYLDNEKWWRNIIDNSYDSWLKVQYG